ncbi:NAD kinase [Prevotella multiformis]|uniref:NAD kinase n=1 Tax=Prevotella multiformis DSM 16608 TaxID=888743 RepID=F0F345_9BACT|nr:NAD kinase [Prevotella multiformis]EGC21261.1 NAD(+)/NADH kinase [Prevotella multiformis DSM 16608]
MIKRRLRFALFGNASKVLESVRIWGMLEYLVRHDAEIYLDQSLYLGLRQKLEGAVAIAGVFEGGNFDVDYVISLGGDGTFLKAAGRVGAKQIPIIGVNMGRLGFLANVNPGDIRATLDEVFAGQAEIEERAVIQLEADGGPLEGCPYALNDIAILKRDNAAMISIRASVNGEYLVTYLADGLVISTPTGSTAYSLSVGGPIIVPQSGILSMTPVAPHSLNIRPIVISDDSEIRLEVESRSHNFLAAVDGRSEKLREGVTLTIRKAPHKVRIVKRSGQRFFSTLREKLMWGADARRL